MVARIILLLFAIFTYNTDAAGLFRLTEARRNLLKAVWNFLNGVKALLTLWRHSPLVFP
jgi:hypothetical protein